MSRIVVENAVKRKTGWIYLIDVEGNLLGYDLVARRRRLNLKIVSNKKKKSEDKK